MCETIAKHTKVSNKSLGIGPQNSEQPGLLLVGANLGYQCPAILCNYSQYK